MKNLLLVVVGAAIGAAIVYFTCCISTEELNATPKRPSGLITPAQASTLDRAFDSRHRLISDSIVKRPDNRSSWYSLEDMTTYLAYAQHEADSLGYQLDGIRVYLGAHAYDGNTIGYTTMFLVPTGTVKKSEGSMLPFVFANSKDIPNGSGLNNGGEGYPPDANYPQ